MQDLFNNLVDNLASTFGVGGTALLTLLIILSLLCRLITKLIPDTATGILGVLRTVTGIIGLYASNRVAPGVTQADALLQTGRVARSAARRVGDIEGVVEKLPVRGLGGKFQKAQSPWVVTLAILLMLLLSGCALVQSAITANPQAAAAGAIAVEARVGLGCVARTQNPAVAGTISDRQVRVNYERILFDSAISPLLSETIKGGINQSRRLTDRLCPPLPGDATLIAPLINQPPVDSPAEPH